MINLTYRVQINRQQEQTMLSWLETCRKVYNYALAERRLGNSRKCKVNSCSIEENISPRLTPYQLCRTMYFIENKKRYRD